MAQLGWQEPDIYGPAPKINLNVNVNQRRPPQPNREETSMPALKSKLNPRSEEFKASAELMRSLVDDLNAKLAQIGQGRRLVLFCAAGWRSALAAKTLQDMGLSEVCHVDGGFTAWKAAGAPVAALPKKG